MLLQWRSRGDRDHLMELDLTLTLVYHAFTWKGAEKD